jgi:hypothetical protein
VLTWDAVVEIGAKLPGVEVSSSYGTPALKVKGKLLVRLKEDGESVVVRTADLDSKEALLAADPDVFFTTPHYDGYPSVLVRLARMRKKAFEELLRDVYLDIAPKKLAHELRARAKRP